MWIKCSTGESMHIVSRKTTTCRYQNVIRKLFFKLQTHWERSMIYLAEQMVLRKFTFLWNWYMFFSVSHFEYFQIFTFRFHNFSRMFILFDSWFLKWLCSIKFLSDSYFCAPLELNLFQNSVVTFSRNIPHRSWFCTSKCRKRTSNICTYCLQTLRALSANR